jgi:MerR family redox-sensitive transcriptional activator SoxR
MYNKVKNATMVNTNDVLMFSTLRLQVDFKSKGIFEKIVSDFRGVQRGSLLGFRVAGDLAISDVARVFGLRTSAIRYYEQIGILPPARRKNGQRRYDNSVLFRLAVVQRARETGFTLEEIRELFFGFPPGTPPPKRWHQLSQRKIAELRDRMKRLKLMETLLKRMENCRCDALDECGQKLLQQGRAEQQKQIEALTAGLQKVSAQFEASKPAPRVVNNQ